jgi:hypothetical protein
MGECEKEKETQHHLGIGSGFGPVQDEEVLLFAVFKTTPIDAVTGRLWKQSFPTKDLVRAEVSVARSHYTSRQEFEERVVGPAINQRGCLIGIAQAVASSIRSINISLPAVRSAASQQAFCVLDKVSPYDFDGHAAIEYSEVQDQLTSKQKATIRERIRADLADVFGRVLLLEEVYPPA